MHYEFNRGYQSFKKFLWFRNQHESQEFPGVPNLDVLQKINSNKDNNGWNFMCEISRLRTSFSVEIEN